MATWWIDDAAASNGADSGGETIGTLYTSPAKYLWASDGTNVGLMSRTTGPKPAAGDIVYVLGGHVETPAANVSMANAGSITNPVAIISVASFNGGSPNTLDSTSVIGTSSNNSVSVAAGGLVMFGFSLMPSNAGGNNSAADINLNTASDFLFRLVDGALIISSTNVGAMITVGASGSSSSYEQLVSLDNVDVKFANSGQSIQLQRGKLEWSGGSLDGSGTIPTALLTTGNVSSPARVALDSLDLSALSTAIVDVSSGTMDVAVSRSKLHASVSPTVGTHPGVGGPTVELVDCDSGDTNIRYHRRDGRGTVNQSASVYRDGGAKSKRNGADVPYSHFLTGSTACGKFLPLMSPWYTAPFVSTTGSKTITIKVAYDRATALTDEELFAEVEYLGASGSTQSSTASSRLATWPLASGSALSNTSETWTGTGGWTNKKTHTLSVSATVAEQGILRVRVGCTVQSVAVYIDPEATVS